MSALDWSTPAGLAAIREHLADEIEGWRDPVAHALALSPATSDPSWELLHVNEPGGRHGLAAVVLATILGHDGSTATLPVSTSQLDAAITSLEPAEACTEFGHPNLAAWRTAQQSLTANPQRELVAVFVADREDPVSSEADGEMRATFEGMHPRA